ncbi:creatininase family protein [Marinicella sp. W31]|uniref:creatininase family protein n=1 Tax=Marinicella sp. W31 TaxID=3023713 RepID=UPI00375649D1
MPVLSWLIAVLILFSSKANSGEYLGDLNWQQAADLIPEYTIIIPFAAGAKEHGPHLPLSTDQIVMQDLLDQAVKHKNVLVVPPILHGWFPAFRDYPGTEIAKAPVFQNYVEAVAESVVKNGAKRIVFLNMGISKATGLPISIVARDIRSNHNVDTLVISWDDLETIETASIYEQERGGHADEGETSIMLYLRPELVDMQKAQKDYRKKLTQTVGYTPGKFDVEKEPGLYGDATLATAEKGQQILKIMRKNWLLALEQFGTSNKTL